LSCKKQNAPTEQNIPQLNEPFDLKIGESVSFDEGQLNFSFDSVSTDTRCPQGTSCVDTGDAIVVVNFFSNLSCSLHTTLSPHSVDRTFRCYAVYSYHIELISLSPYPKLNQQILQNSYIAKFLVRHTKIVCNIKPSYSLLASISFQNIICRLTSGSS
jgi:hypothetical protein